MERPYKPLKMQAKSWVENGQSHQVAIYQLMPYRYEIATSDPWLEDKLSQIMATRFSEIGIKSKRAVYVEAPHPLYYQLEEVLKNSPGLEDIHPVDRLYLLLGGSINHTNTIQKILYEES